MGPCRRREALRLKVVLSGYFGFDNLGDEAVLAGVLKALQETGLAVEPVVLSAAPQKTQQVHRVAAVPRGLGSAWRALKGAAALISGGGSLLQDVTSLRSPFYYLAVMELARRAGARVVWFAQGIGPLRRQLVRRMVARAARQAQLVVVRDERSRRALQELGLADGRVRVGADVVWLLAQPRPPSPPGPPPPGPHGVWRLAVIWRDWPGRPAQSAEVGRALGRALGRWEQNRGKSALVRVLAMQPPRDLAACQALAAGMRQGWPEGTVQVAACPAQPLEFVRELSGFDAVISARLHGLVLAAVAGVPMAGIGWDPKLEALAEELRWPLHGPAPASLADEAAWFGCLSRLGDEGAQLRGELVRAACALHERAVRSVQWLREALEQAQPGGR